MPPRLTTFDEARLAILLPLRQRLAEATFGTKKSLAQAAADALGCSVSKVYADLDALGYGDGRKTRADAGKRAVSDAEVIEVAQIVASAYRENNKRLMSINNAIKHARANGLLQAACSTSTMCRRMRELNVHPEQFERPPAHKNLASDHPNQIWQVDPSYCVIYRMPSGAVGVTNADDELIYKNKLENLDVLNKRNKVWRYVQWDHYSSAFFFMYFETPGESTEVLLEFLIEATRRKPGFLMHGWPDLLLWDKGSANKAAAVRNVLGQLGVRHRTHKARNARAKGGVENCNDLIECGFESCLSFSQMPTVEELNRRAFEWQIDQNSLEICSRHGHARYGVWQTIREHQLRLSPPAEEVRLAANKAPEERQVNGDLTVSFDGSRWNVEHIKVLSAGDKVMVSQNIYSRETVWVLAKDEHGVERQHACSEVTKNIAGFWSNAQHIDAMSPLADRPVDTARKDLREAVWGSRDENEAITARRKGRVALDGKVDPFKAVELRKDSIPDFVQRRGVEIATPSVMHVEPRHVSMVGLLMEARRRLGDRYGAREAEAIQAWHPEGLPDDQLETLFERLEQLDAAGAPPAPAAPRLVAVR